MISGKSVYSYVATKDSFLLSMVDTRKYDQVLALRPGSDAPWLPPLVSVVERNVGRTLVPVDIPSLGGGDDCVNTRARAMLEGPLSDCARFLPLACDREPFWLMRVTRVVDALDEARSETRRVPSGLVTLIKRPVFFPDRLPTGGLFRVPQFWPKVYAMQDFVDRVHDAGLTGLTFKRVWYPDEGS